MTVTVNGLQFHVEETGEGPVVLLLHGFPDTGEVWRRQVPALAAVGFRAIVPDLRGRDVEYTASRGSATRSRAGGRTRVAEMARLRSELANREVPSQATHRRASRARGKAPACRSTSPR